MVGPRRLRRSAGALALVAVTLVVTVSCSTADGGAEPASTVTPTVTPTSVATVTSTAPGTTAPPVDDVTAFEQELADRPLDVGDDGPWSSSLLSGAGDAVDADMLAALDAAEASTLADARRAVGEQQEVEVTTVPPATTAPQGFRRRQDAVGAFGLMAFATISISDLFAGTPGNQVSATGSTSVAGAGASGSVTVGVGGGTDARGANTGQLSLQLEVTGADGRTASVTIAADVAGRPCPGDDGILEIEFRGAASGSWAGPGTSSQDFTGTATAHFDDDGEVAEIEVDARIEASRSTGTSDATYADLQYALRITGVFGGTVDGSENVTVNRSSSRFSATDATDRAMVNDAIDAVQRFAFALVGVRRQLVQNNGCVTVQAQAPGSVSPQQTVPIDVHTRHVVEGIELDERVAATLTGAGSVDPDRLATTAGTITYTAGERAGDTGTLRLESRSKRGIGWTTLTITVASAYRIDQQVGDLRLSGAVCGLDEPFTLESAPPAPGSITFTPTQPGGGTYAGTGQVAETQGQMVWEGTYTVDATDPERPMIRMDEGNTTMINIPVIGEAPLPGFWQGGVTFELVPDPAAC